MLFRSVRWYQEAVDQGQSRAQYHLAWCYEHGKGVGQDLEKAMELYQAAAKQNYEGAQEAYERLRNGAGPALAGTKDLKDPADEIGRAKLENPSLKDKAAERKTISSSKEKLKKDKGGFLRGLFGGKK